MKHSQIQVFIVSQNSDSKNLQSDSLRILLGVTLD